MKKTVTYQNGNTLSYADFGDPAGDAILIQHGLIASIHESGLFERLIETGRRPISIARPGYGESSPYGMKNIAEWGEIVAVLVEELGLARFDVLGISSGAPYSYAIGYQFPDRARNIYILSGTPALYDDGVLAHWPYPVNKNASLTELQKLAYDLFFSHLSQADMEKDEIKDSTRYDCFGIAQDFQLRGKDWGFPMSEVKGRVTMRHSKADESVPFITAELTSKILPNCRLDVRENDVHFSKEVLDDFIRTVMAGHPRQEH